MEQKIVVAFISSLALSAAVSPPSPALQVVASTRNVVSEQTSKRGQIAPSIVFDESNPFAQSSSLPFKAPPFDKIKDSDFQPALEEGMRRQLAEIELIANNSEAPTFANTIEAMECSGELLRRVQPVFGGMVSSNINPTLQKLQTEEAPKFSAHRDAIYFYYDESRQ